MKALIISDTHGLKQEVSRITQKVKLDKGFHCGDFCVDQHLPPFNKMILVQGNNDFRAKVPKEQLIEWGGLRVFITHGHLYQVEQSLLKLKYKAEEVAADIVLFGHTHYPLCEEEEGVIYVNPGSLKKPRGFTVPTFVILNLKPIENGKKSLSFTYYDPAGRKIEQLSKTYIR